MYLSYVPHLTSSVHWGSAKLSCYYFQTCAWSAGLHSSYFFCQLVVINYFTPALKFFELLEWSDFYSLQSFIMTGTSSFDYFTLVPCDKFWYLLYSYSYFAYRWYQWSPKVVNTVFWWCLICTDFGLPILAHLNM